MEIDGAQTLTSNPKPHWRSRWRWRRSSPEVEGGRGSLELVGRKETKSRCEMGKKYPVII